MYREYTAGTPGPGEFSRNPEVSVTTGGKLEIAADDTPRLQFELVLAQRRHKSAQTLFLRQFHRNFLIGITVVDCRDFQRHLRFSEADPFRGDQCRFHSGMRRVVRRLGSFFDLKRIEPDSRIIRNPVPVPPPELGEIISIPLGAEAERVPLPLPFRLHPSQFRDPGVGFRRDVAGENSATDTNRFVAFHIPGKRIGFPRFQLELSREEFNHIRFGIGKTDALPAVNGRSRIKLRFEIAPAAAGEADHAEVGGIQFKTGVADRVCRSRPGQKHSQQNAQDTFHRTNSQVIPLTSSSRLPPQNRPIDNVRTPDCS